MEMVLRNPAERIDDLQRGGCRIIQRPDLFCFGMDAVLLAAWARVKPGQRVLDLCSGNGAVPILMDARMPEEIREAGSVSFAGVEINSTSVDLARRSARMNGQSGRIHFLEKDIRNVCRRKDAGKLENGHPCENAGKPENGRPCEDVGKLENGHPGKDAGKPRSECGGLDGEDAPESFDLVTVNPPYMTGGGGLTGESADKAIARHEVLCTIDDVAGAASRALKSGGHLYMVHRPHRLGDLMHALEAHNLALKRMRMVHPFADREANLVLIDAAKGGRMYVHVEKPLVIYRQAGVYTEEVKALYG